MKNRYIDNSNIRPRVPIATLWMWWLTNQVAEIPDWINGAVGLALAVVSIAAIHIFFNSESVDLLNKKKQ
jgi:hypothetical protein